MVNNLLLSQLNRDLRVVIFLFSYSHRTQEAIAVPFATFIALKLTENVDIPYNFWRMVLLNVTESVVVNVLL